MNAFHSKYTSLFRSHFPGKLVRKGHRLTPRQEWMTDGLVKSCVKKAKLFKKYKKNWKYY
jgi:hypothetical protein